MIEVDEQFVFEEVEIAKPDPGQLGAEVFPDALSGIEFGAMRRLEEQGDVVGNDQPLCRMGARIVEEDDIKTVGMGGGKGIQKDLHIRGIQLREDQPIRIATGDIDRAIQPTAPAAILRDDLRFHAAGRNAPPADGAQTPAAFILRKEAERPGFGRGDQGADLIGDRGLEGGDGGGVVFLGVGRGTLALPPKRARTRLPTALVVISTPWVSNNQIRIAS